MNIGSGSGAAAAAPAAGGAAAGGAAAAAPAPEPEPEEESEEDMGFGACMGRGHALKICLVGYSIFFAPSSIPRLSHASLRSCRWLCSILFFASRTSHFHPVPCSLSDHYLIVNHL